MEEVDRANAGITNAKRDLVDVAAMDPLMLNARPKRELHEDEAVEKRQGAGQDFDADANAGSDYDAIPDEEGGEIVPQADLGKLSIPNSVFRPARILVNPRCVTTYAGVSHTQLALDLFGDGEDDAEGVGKYVLEDWEGAPESFVCQEQRYVYIYPASSLQTNDRCFRRQTGGRKATKTQRRLGFSIHDELQKLSS
jgi:hypothetical protein